MKLSSFCSLNPKLSISSLSKYLTLIYCGLCITVNLIYSKKDFFLKVDEFYRKGKPKKIPTDDFYRKGFLSFQNEWEMLKSYLSYGKLIACNEYNEDQSVSMIRTKQYEGFYKARA